MASERVELARPFAVVDHNQRVVEAFANEFTARMRCQDHNEGAVPHFRASVVRLTAERVEEPIPEAKSGWWYEVRTDEEGDVGVYAREAGASWNSIVFPVACGARTQWRARVPPCDHAHVAELLRREGVE